MAGQGAGSDKDGRVAAAVRWMEAEQIAPRYVFADVFQHQHLDGAGGNWRAVDS